MMLANTRQHGYSLFVERSPQPHVDVAAAEVRQGHGSAMQRMPPGKRQEINEGKRVGWGSKSTNQHGAMNGRLSSADQARTENREEAAASPIIVGVESTS